MNKRDYWSTDDLEISIDELVKYLGDMYDELWPIGHHVSEQWGSAADWVESLAMVLEQAFGRRPTDHEGNYIHKDDERLELYEVVMGPVRVWANDRIHAGEQFDEMLNAGTEIPYTYRLVPTGPDSDGL